MRAIRLGGAVLGLATVAAAPMPTERTILQGQVIDRLLAIAEDGTISLLAQGCGLRSREWQDRVQAYVDRRTTEAVRAGAALFAGPMTLEMIAVGISDGAGHAFERETRLYFPALCIDLARSAALSGLDDLAGKETPTRH